MKVSIAREVRRKYIANPVPLRKPSTERPPVTSAKETPTAAGPSFEIPVAEEPFSPKKKYKRGTSSRRGT